MISFSKRKITWKDKLKFKNFSMILLSLSMYKENTWKKEGKRRQNFQKILPNNHCMPHRTSSTRNDYEQKINYDWPNTIKFFMYVYTTY